MTVERDKKEWILENVKRMGERISSLEKELESAREKLRLEKEKHNLCWWDARPCARYTEIAGLQGAGRRCFDCHRVDEDKLSGVLKEIDLENYKSEIKEQVEEEMEERKEKQEESLQEIHEKVIDLLVAAGVEPSD